MKPHLHLTNFDQLTRPELLALAKPRPRSSRQHGFSLIELLVVIVIISILSCLTVPSLLGLSTSFKFSSAVNSLSDTLSFARQTAVGRNTYVWVALAVPVAPTDPPLSAVVIASSDGTNPFATNWSQNVVLPCSSFYVVTETKSYSQCQFLEAGMLTPQQIPTLPSTGIAPSQGSTGNGLGTNLSFTVRNGNGTLVYNRVIEYTPSGLAYNGINPIDFVEFGVQPGFVPTTILTKNVAVVRVPFITGRALLYRP